MCYSILNCLYIQTSISKSTMEGIKILIADDEPDILELLHYNLSKEGYNVVTAGTGTQAIEVAKSENPDLIILDIMMPEMDGVNVCEELRKLDQFKDTLIAFLTARGEDFTQISCYEAGGDDFIVKPIKPKVFLSRVKALLKRRSNVADKSTEHILSIGDLTIDKEKVKVLRNDKEISLVKKEYELLLLLASKPGKVFSRQEIFNRIWDMDVIVGDRTIDVHIRRLREKLGEDLIKTVKGMGYKFEF